MGLAGERERAKESAREGEGVRERVSEKTRERDTHRGSSVLQHVFGGIIATDSSACTATTTT